VGSLRLMTAEGYGLNTEGLHAVPAFALLPLPDPPNALGA
jgi:hypothetical protein